MTPQEYIDRERLKAWTNLKKANDRNDAKAAKRLSEKLEVLKEIEAGLETVTWRRTQACGLMRMAAKILATMDSMDQDYSIVATWNGEEYTIQDILLGMCGLVNAWEGDEEA